MDDNKKFKLSIGSRVLKRELKNDGAIPVISANVFEPFGMTNSEIIKDYSKPYVLWGIDGDWMVRCMKSGDKFYPTDHCGYIKILDNSINPLYFSIALKEEGDKQRFSRSNRASTDRVSSLVINLPSINVQNKVAEEIESLNEKIKKMEKYLDELSAKKDEVIDKFLN